MKVYKEISLKDFDFEGYAEYVASKMSDEEFEIIERWMEEEGHEWSEIEVNDLFAFNYDFLDKLLGYVVSKDDEPKDIDNDCGYDAFEGDFTYDV